VSAAQKPIAANASSLDFRIRWLSLDVVLNALSQAQYRCSLIERFVEAGRPQTKDRFSVPIRYQSNGTRDHLSLRKALFVIFGFIFFECKIACNENAPEKRG
jgi:hypothetical protein